ncbi:hypothetical protein Acsp05_35300 [Actinokineospora sp. NBRC 105648]|nr:hypothetical protein Acsp05_35300 [Actinokineospora sp. NBRC 105648]
MLAAITMAAANGKIGVETVALTIAFAIGATAPLLLFALAGAKISERVSFFRDHNRAVRAGLRVAGVHTPEFAFERDLGNVESATRKVRYFKLGEGAYDQTEKAGPRTAPAEPPRRRPARPGRTGRRDAERSAGHPRDLPELRRAAQDLRLRWPPVHPRAGQPLPVSSGAWWTGTHDDSAERGHSPQGRARCRQVPALSRYAQAVAPEPKRTGTRR